MPSTLLRKVAKIMPAFTPASVQDYTKFTFMDQS